MRARRCRRIWPRRSPSRRRAARGRRPSSSSSASPSPSTARAGHHTMLSMSGAIAAGSVRGQHREARQRAVGQDGGDLQRDDEAGADDGGENLRHQPRAARADQAKQQDRRPRSRSPRPTDRWRRRRRKPRTSGCRRRSRARRRRASTNNSAIAITVSAIAAMRIENTFSSRAGEDMIRSRSARA